MSFAAYAPAAEDDPRAARRLEVNAFDRAISLLEQAGRADDRLSRVRASAFVRRLWAELMRDLAESDNELAPPLRASLISIGAWMLKEADRVADEERAPLAPMLDIHRLVRAGLV